MPFCACSGVCSLCVTLLELILVLLSSEVPLATTALSLLDVLGRLWSHSLLPASASCKDGVSTSYNTLGIASGTQKTCVFKVKRNSLN